MVRRLLRRIEPRVEEFNQQKSTRRGLFGLFEEKGIAKEKKRKERERKTPILATT